ncbi:hypothetical protein CEXT_659621 [Caerostris extrusa]|uniref:Uncharacterized protein n=1 Tax=Caerostris extrusa TaxID=172846 RepID=A0AAV4PES8_CAEEX|nr:hypothetical protein CEXT_659621 [Caerostris extrusa]
MNPSNRKDFIRKEVFNDGKINSGEEMVKSSGVEELVFSNPVRLENTSSSHPSPKLKDERHEYCYSYNSLFTLHSALKFSKRITFGRLELRFPD